MKKLLRNSIIAAMSAGSFVLGGLFASIGLETKNDDKKDNFFNPKPYEYVLNDIDSFGADPSIAYNITRGNYDKLIRLKFRDNIPVIVDCVDLEDREVKMIEDIVGYYNGVFSSINENYKFTIKNDETVVSEDDVVVSIVNGSVGDNYVYGLNTRSFYKSGNLDGFVFNAEIIIDWEEIKDKEDLFIYEVIFHEFTHTLGLGDVYFFGENNVSKCVDMSTTMHVSNGIKNILYPNDYAILQALYSNEYKKHNNYEDAVKVVNEKIEKYTKAFYKQYASVLKENNSATDKLADVDFFEEIEWKGQHYYDKDFLFKLKFLSNNKCELTIENENGELLEKCEGQTLFVDGVLFVRNLYVKEASNYSKIYMNGVSMKLMLSIYIDNNSNLIVRNSEFDVTNVKTIELEENKNKKI